MATASRSVSISLPASSTRFDYEGKELLVSALVPNFWRAPTDNDYGNDMPSTARRLARGGAGARHRGRARTARTRIATSIVDVIATLAPGGSKLCHELSRLRERGHCRRGALRPGSAWAAGLAALRDVAHAAGPTSTTSSGSGVGRTRPTGTARAAPAWDVTKPRRSSSITPTSGLKRTGTGVTCAGSLS